MMCPRKQTLKNGFVFRFWVQVTYKLMTDPVRKIVLVSEIFFASSAIESS